MKNCKLFLAVFVFIGLSLGAAAQVIVVDSGYCGAQGNNLEWKLTSDSVLTISGSGDMADYANTFEQPWYSYQNSITTILIGDSVTTIGVRAFGSCQRLTSLTIGNSVTTIKLFAFANCIGLTSITIPSNVTTIEGNVFLICNKLISIDVDDNNIYYSSENGVLFDKSKTLLIKYPGGNLNKNYIIPNSVTTIEYCAFFQSHNLTSVTIPNSVTTIENEVFSGCESLVLITNLNPEPITINSNVFYNVNQSACTLEVPMGSISAYRNAAVWKNFNIAGIEVGIKIIENVARIKIYPNPTNGQLRITNYEGGEIEIYDVIGQCVGTNLRVCPNGNTIDVSHLAKGMYYLKIENKIVKFVKE